MTREEPREEIARTKGEIDTDNKWSMKQVGNNQLGASGRKKTEEMEESFSERYFVDAMCRN